jgi:hypothetical protein
MEMVDGLILMVVDLKVTILAVRDEAEVFQLP